MLEFVYFHQKTLPVSFLFLEDWLLHNVPLKRLKLQIFGLFEVNWVERPNTRWHGHSFGLNPFLGYLGVI